MAAAAPLALAAVLTAQKLHPPPRSCLDRRPLQRLGPLPQARPKTAAPCVEDVAPYTAAAASLPKSSKTKPYCSTLLCYIDTLETILTLFLLRAAGYRSLAYSTGYPKITANVSRTLSNVSDSVDCGLACRLDRQCKAFTYIESEPPPSCATSDEQCLHFGF